MQRLVFFALAMLCGSVRSADWISVPTAPVATMDDVKAERAADGTSWFIREFVIEKEVAKAVWTVSGLGVFEAFVNGKRVGDDFLKPGFTHPKKTKYSFAYDVTELLTRGGNTLTAEVSSGWWRDRVVAHTGRKSAFLGELVITYRDGSRETIATDTAEWRGTIGGPVTHAGIFDGEEYDARIPAPDASLDGWLPVEVNREFPIELKPTVGAEITLRRDLAMKRGPYSLKKGETLVVDFGQNCAGVPEFVFEAKRGTVLTCLPGEMLNDSDQGVRGCDGPKGSVYRANLRMPDRGMRLRYTFAGKGVETYLPRFTFFGYRYLSIAATDDVNIESVTSVPVTSIKKEMETGKLETGDSGINKLISNIYWGQLSNYLSVPTDCPQRNERQGWTADTQVFAEAGAFNARTYEFFRKYLRDLRDTQTDYGAYTGVAPFGAYWTAGDSRFGWSDCGIIVPYIIWKQFGETDILKEHWSSMRRFMSWLDDNRYAKYGALEYQWADWLSYEPYESCGGGAWDKGEDGKSRLKPEASLYWKYLGGCYYLSDARMMREMAAALGKNGEAEEYRLMADRALAYIKAELLEDGRIPACLRKMQTPALFALHCGILEPKEAARAKEALLENISNHGDCLQTGFLGTSILMDTLTEVGSVDVAYMLLLQHKNPSWLYSVDQGATTIWERWNSYTKKDGFGPVGMNSFNHYAYGAVLAWIYRTVAGIAADPSAPGFANIIMSPIPDRRLGFVKAEYMSPKGLVKSSWRYEGEKWIWDFTIPVGATAEVTVPGTSARKYGPGAYHLEKELK